MSKPLVSIVVPVYNVENYLDEALSSLVQQEFTNWEAILVDDGSTDLSSQICRRFVEDDSRFSYFYQENAGQATARNKGIVLSKSEWIAFLDSDDYWTKDKLSQQIALIETTEVDFIFALGYILDPKKNVATEEYDWVTGAFSGEDFFKELCCACAVNTNTVLIRRHIFDEVGCFDEHQDIRGTEDWDLWLRIARAGYRIFGMTERLAIYRIHPEGSHFNYERMYKGKCRIWQKYDHDPLLEEPLRLWKYRIFARNLIVTLGEKRKWSELRAYSDFLATKDLGLATKIQGVLFSLLPPRAAWFLCRHLLFRAAWKLEARPLLQHSSSSTS